MDEASLNKTKKMRNRWLVLSHICRHFPFRLISDENYLKISYKAYLGEFPDLVHPKSYTEKIQWLKIHDRNPLYTQLSDKYKVRQFVEKKIGSQYLVPLLGCWKSTKEIDYDSLPEQFVLKCNHDSGSIVICRSKESFDRKKAEKKLKKALKRQYFWNGREYNYKDIPRRIVAEKYLKDGNSDELTDYKYFCFNGEPKFVQVDTGRFSEHIKKRYDVDWKFIDVKSGCENNPNKEIPMPEQHEQMLELSRILSKGFPHVRVDFYVSDGKIYFGELTFHSGGGFMKIEPKNYDNIWGEYIDCSLVQEKEK